jgi:hypothetical protein
VKASRKCKIEKPLGEFYRRIRDGRRIETTVLGDQISVALL